MVLIWGLWDWGSAGFATLAMTFVYTVYLTRTVGSGLPGEVSPTTWLGWGVGLAGFVVAMLAAGIGPWIGAGRRRDRSLIVLTIAVVAVMAIMANLPPDYHWFFPGIALLAVGIVLYELATVPYNAMLRDVSATRELGDVSGLGFAMGFAGGISVLGVCYLAFRSGGRLDIQVTMLFGALWVLVFTSPLLFLVGRRPADTPSIVGRRPAQTLSALGFLESYRAVGRSVRELWRADRQVAYYLVASAVFRDGIVGIASFGGVLAVNAYGVGPDEVLLFGVAANLAAAVCSAVGGRFDDRLGSKQVIVVGLSALLLLGAGLLVSTGPTAFWVFGLLLSCFFGPVQASARTMLIRLTPPGKEGEMFGLYTTCGRTVSFLSPLSFALFAHLFHADRAGVAGIMAVIAVGFALMTLVQD